MLKRLHIYTSWLVIIFCIVNAHAVAAQDALLDDWLQELLKREVASVNGIAGMRELCGEFRTKEFEAFHPEWNSPTRAQIFFCHRGITRDILGYPDNIPVSASLFGASILIEYSPINIAAKSNNTGVFPRFLERGSSFANIFPQIDLCSMSEEKNPYAMFADSNMPTSPTIYSNALIATDALSGIANASAWLYTDVGRVPEHYLKKDGRTLNVDKDAMIQDVRILPTGTPSAFSATEPAIGGNIFCCRRKESLTTETFLCLSRIVRNMGIANHLVFIEKKANGVLCYLNEMTALHPNGSVVLSHSKSDAGNALMGYQCRISYGLYLENVLAILPFNAERSRKNMAQLQIQYYGEGCSLSEQEQMIAFIAGCSFPRSRLPNRCSVLSMDKDRTDILFDGPIYGGMKNTISFKRSRNRWIFSGYSWTNRSYRDLKAAFFPRASRNDVNP